MASLPEWSFPFGRFSGQSETLEMPTNRFLVGQRVRIVDGPYSSAIGMIHSTYDNEHYGIRNAQFEDSGKEPAFYYGKPYKLNGRTNRDMRIPPMIYSHFSGIETI